MIACGWVQGGILYQVTMKMIFQGWMIHLAWRNFISNFFTPMVFQGCRIVWRRYECFWKLIQSVEMFFQSGIARCRHWQVVIFSEGPRTGNEISALNAELGFIVGEQFECTESTPQCTSTSFEKHDNNGASLGRSKSIQNIDSTRPRIGICISIVTHNTCDCYCIARWMHWQPIAAF